jgi:multidrug resistance efflux pump
MDSVTPPDTLLALKVARDKCQADLTKMKRSVEGMQAKVLQMEAKLEMAEEMLEIAKRGSAQPKKEPTT